MPRSRGSEMPQRQSPRGLHHLRTSSSDSDQSHHRPITDRSPKVGDRRSPRGVQSDSLNQKKLGTRIADLECQLGQAQEELKILKEQLASAEAAKKEVQEELEKKIKKPGAPKAVVQVSNKKYSRRINEIPEENQAETDVFEVPPEKVSVGAKVILDQSNDQAEKEANQVGRSADPLHIMEPEKPTSEDLKDNEINLLKIHLQEKEKKLELFSQENESLKNQLNEAATEILAIRIKEEEMALKLCKLDEELETSKGNAAQLHETLETVEGAKEALEAEMKKLRVQTEQWRKAADAAAAVLAGGVEMNGRIAERCSSMDKNCGGMFDARISGYASFVGSPGMAYDLDAFGNGKKKSSGIRMFGELWKKKNQK